jgi:hypothetical protein
LTAAEDATIGNRGRAIGSNVLARWLARFARRLIRGLAS